MLESALEFKKQALQLPPTGDTLAITLSTTGAHLGTLSALWGRHSPALAVCDRQCLLAFACLAERAAL